MLTKEQISQMSLAELLAELEKLAPTSPETQAEWDKLNQQIAEILNL